MKLDRIAILGAGNIGQAIGHAILIADLAGEVVITRQNDNFTEEEKKKFTCLTDNAEAVRKSSVVIIATQPKQADKLLLQIRDSITTEHLLISVVSGLSIARIEELIGKMPIVRAMLNTAIRVRQSMTFLAFSEVGREYRFVVEEVFKSVGLTLHIEEKMFPQATVLGGSGVALVLELLRADMKSAIQHGFNAEEALTIAGQVFKGAAMLVQENHSHPEIEIDKVCTPKGCTVDLSATLAHEGATSAILKANDAGIGKAEKLYT